MMDDQKILDNAPPKQGKWPDCNQVDSDGKWSHREPVIRSLADIKDLVELRKANAELEKGYEELRMAALHAVCKIGGGQAKADLRDAYDKATEQLEALKEKG
jgi:hypothetical protein